MRSIILALLLLPSVYSQVFVRGSMGLDFVSMPSVRDYINQNYAPGNEQLSSFNSAIEFGVEAGWHFPGYDVAVEGAYAFSNYNYIIGFSQYNFDYTIYKPTVIVYKRFDGEGYFFRLGAGAGPRFAVVEETKPPIKTVIEYKTSGFGILLAASGNTRLSKNAYIYIAGDLRYDFNGDPENDKGEKILYDANASTLTLNSLSAGIKLGITYNF